MFRILCFIKINNNLRGQIPVVSWIFDILLQISIYCYKFSDNCLKLFYNITYIVTRNTERGKHYRSRHSNIFACDCFGWRANKTPPGGDVPRLSSRDVGGRRTDTSRVAEFAPTDVRACPPPPATRVRHHFSEACGSVSDEFLVRLACYRRPCGCDPVVWPYLGRFVLR